MTAGPWLGVVADDFTGATDLAGLVAAEGTSVTLFFGTPSAAEIADVDTDCVVIALKSRSISVAAAVAQSVCAAAALSGVEHLYFKYCSTFDSTAKGNIGPVAEALAELRGTDRVAVVPSAPGNGRTVYQGRLFVGAQLLEESSLRNHPVNPMRDSLVSRLLRPQTTWPTHLVRLQDVLKGPAAVSSRISAAERPSHVVIDAITDADLDTIAVALAAMGARLSTGSAGLAAALARTHSSGAARAETKALPGALPDFGPESPTLVLSGSTSTATRDQVAAFVRDNPSRELSPFDVDEDFGIVDEIMRFVDEAIHRGRVPLVYSTVDSDEIVRAQAELGAGVAARRIEDALSRIAVHALAHGVRRLIVAGGETSGAVVNALGITRVVVRSEVAAGVPWVLAGVPASCALLLKSGNFGGNEFFTRAVESDAAA